MTVPTRWALVWLVVAAGCCLLAVVDPRWVLAALVLDLAVLLVVIFQGRALARRPVVVQREWDGQPQAGVPSTLRLIIENPGDRPASVAARQVWPATCPGDEHEWRVALGPRESVSYTVNITPGQRGVLRLPPVEVDLTTPLGLAAFRRRFEHGGEVTVYPNLRGVTAYETLRRSRAFRAAGFHRQRMVGMGREFDQMREYLPGDDYRDVNWKATARLGSPLTNLYQTERSRDMIICLDGGRMMGNPVAGRSTLDYAVDAAMLLAHAGHDQGDRVGLVTFRDRVDTVVRPGTSNGPTILKTLAQFDSRPVFPSYLSLIEALRSRQSHRALVFLLTDLNDPQLSADLAELMPMLVSRHLAVVVSLRDTLVERVAAGPAGSRSHGVSRVLAARAIANERLERTRQLTKIGVQVLQADAEHLSLDLINHYMAVKSRQLV